MVELCAEHEQATGVLCSVNFVEVYIPVCFSKSAHTFKQSYGGVFDMRYGWDFSNAVIRGSVLGYAQGIRSDFDHWLATLCLNADGCPACC